MYGRLVRFALPYIRFLFVRPGVCPAGFLILPSGFLQIPPHGGHPCLRLTVPTAKSVVDFHHQVIAHAGRTIWYYLKDWGGMAAGWQQIDGVWYYLRSNGAMAADSWVQSGGQWYYLRGNGEMATNRWVKWKGDWYFLYSTGVMATNTTIDGYSVGADGVWKQ